MSVATDDNSLDYECDWRMGFNLNPSSKGRVGYLLFWSGCGGLSLSKDIEVYNPYSGSGQTVETGSTIKCIGLIEKFEFGGGDEDPIRITCYSSRETAANVRAKLASPISSTSVQVAWYIIDFDEDRKEWYEAAFVQNSAKASANLDTMGGEVQLFIESQATRVSDVLDLKVYQLEFQIVPAEGSSSTLEFATGSTQKLVKSWGSA
jgi:hypothetical protein